MTHCYTGFAGMETWRAMMRVVEKSYTSKRLIHQVLLPLPWLQMEKFIWLSEYGELYIVQSGPEYKLLKKIPLGEVSLVTPAIAPGMLVLRTASRLMAISNG